MLFRVLIPLGIVSMLALAAGCGGSSSTESIDLKQVTLPGGQLIRAEVLMRRNDMMRGMMYRSKQLPPDRGLLFVHPRPGNYPYWMHNVQVPLDIIWMDKDHRIVEISINTPPCGESDPVKCPNFGGKVPSQFVLELAAGMSVKYGLAVDQQVTF